MGWAWNLVGNQKGKILLAIQNFPPFGAQPF